MHENSNSVLDKAYLRKKILVPKLMQIQKSNPDPKHEFNIKNAFLHRKLKKKIYMEVLLEY